MQMHDHFSDLYEWDENGNKRRKKRVARDGERFHWPMMMTDHSAYGFQPTFSDGSPDHTSPHKPGYRFADTADAARLAADEAYEARRRRMETAWQRKGEPQQEDAPKPALTLDAARAAADQAWEERNARMRDAWKQR